MQLVDTLAVNESARPHHPKKRIEVILSLNADGEYSLSKGSKEYNRVHQAIEKVSPHY